MADFELDDLVQNAREVDQPSPERRERLFERVMVGVGAVGLEGGQMGANEAGGVPDLSAAPLAGEGGGAALGTGVGLKVALSLVAVVGIGAAIAFSSGPLARQPQDVGSGQMGASATKPLEPPSPQTLPAPSSPAATETEEVKATPALKKQQQEAQSRDTLSAEVALVRKAKVALNEKRYQEALGALDEYQAKFGSGALWGEAQATRVLVLCALKESAQARAAANQLDEASALGKRMKEGCKAR